MATAYRIESKQGVDYGTWAGETEADALAALHRDAGYDVRAGGGKLIFASESDRALCGDVGDWHITEER